MYLSLCVCAILLLASAQQCCADPPSCPANSTCLCQSGVDACMFLVNQQKQTFTLDNTTVSYFYWMPTAEVYGSIFVFFCPESGTNSTYNVGFYVQDSDGSGYPSNLSSSFTSNGSGGCWMYQLSVGSFCKVPNGSYCDLMMGVQLSGPASTQLTIYINAIQGAFKFLVPILVAIGVTLLAIVIVLVACIIRRRIRARRNALTKVDVDLTHFEQYFPKLTLQQVKALNSLRQQVYNCSVCLLDLEQADLVRRAICGHIFHADCMDVWCKKNISCPICRQPLDKESLQKKKLEGESARGLVNGNADKKSEQQNPNRGAESPSGQSSIVENIRETLIPNSQL